MLYRSNGVKNNMNQEIKKEIIASIQQFHLPLYHEIPDTGLYLDQTAQYVTQYLAPLEDGVLTGSMIRNYVKKKLISNPVKKQYNRDQIAYLFFIAAAKSVLSMDEIGLMVRMQKESYTPQVAYDYFCNEFENILQYIFSIKESVASIGYDDTAEKQMLRNLIISVSHKIYLNKYLSRLYRNEDTIS